MALLELFDEKNNKVQRNWFIFVNDCTGIPGK